MKQIFQTVVGVFIAIACAAVLALAILGIIFIKVDSRFEPLRNVYHQVISFTDTALNSSCTAEINVQYLDQDQHFYHLSTLKVNLSRQEKQNGKKYWTYSRPDYVEQQMLSLVSEVTTRLRESGMNPNTDIIFDTYRPWEQKLYTLRCPFSGYDGEIVIMADDIQTMVGWNEGNYVEWNAEKIHYKDLSSIPGAWTTVFSPGEIPAHLIVGTFHLNPTIDARGPTMILEYLQKNSYCKVTVLGDPNNGYLVNCSNSKPTSLMLP